MLTTVVVLLSLLGMVGMALQLGTTVRNARLDTIESTTAHAYCGANGFAQRPQSANM